VWVPEVVEKEVQCVRYEYEVRTRKVPYTVCRMVPEVKTGTCTYTVCRWVSETVTRKVPVQTCRYVQEQVVRRVPYTEMRLEQYQRRVTCVRYVEKQVPYTVTQCEPRVVYKQVPVQVCCPVPSCKESCCGG